MASLLEALIMQESGGNPRALNPRTGAMGLMQIMPDTARDPGFGVKPLTDPWNADENKRFGTDYLNAMQRRYPGDQDAALAAYNWGPGNADKWVASGKTSPLPAETRNYIDSINARVGGGQERPQERAMPDPFEQLWPPQGGQRPDGNPMQPPMAQAPQMPTPGNSMVPGIMGGGDQPGYFGNLMSDPTFLTGASVLSGGLAGQDFGTALGRGAQGAQAQAEMFDKRRKAAAWNKMFPANGPPNLNAPLLKGLPPDVIPLVAQLGPEEGMNTLVRFAFKRMEPRQLTSVAPGATLYDERGGQAVYTAPAAPEKAPAGFRSVEGGNLEAIPGGPATQMSGDQAGRIAMMRNARGGLEQAKAFFSDMGISGRAGKIFNMGEAGEAERTVTSAIEATLRALTGAAATTAEVERLEKLFAPTVYDAPNTRAEKLQRLEAFIDEAEGVLTQGRGGMPQRPPQGQPGAPGGQGGQGRTDDPLGIL